MQPIRFNPDQRAELVRLGLVDLAIKQVEVEGLPAAQFILSREPPRGAVLDELSAVASAVEGARNGIERLLNATDAAPHRVAARSLISGGGRRYAMGGMRLDETSKALAIAMEVITDAMGRIPPEPLRHRQASAFPIKRIYSAVQHGFMMAGREPVAPGLKPSASPTSNFRRLIGICYEAIGASTDDPERAIKSYVKEWRNLEKYMAKVKAAQNAPEEPDVLS